MGLFDRDFGDAPDPRRELGPARPDRLTIWPVEGDRFGIDVEYRGAAGHAKAMRVVDALTQAGVAGKLRQGLEGEWIVRVGPVEREDMLAVVNGFIW